MPSSSAWPTFIAFAPATSFSTNWSWMDWCTTNRDDAVHFWPDPPNAPPKASDTARSRSASSITANAFFDPISICTRVRFWMALARDPFAHRNRAGEADRIDLWAFHQPLTNRTARAHHQRHEARGDVLARDDLNQGYGGGRVLHWLVSRRRRCHSKAPARFSKTRLRWGNSTAR